MNTSIDVSGDHSNHKTTFVVKPKLIEWDKSWDTYIKIRGVEDFKNLKVWKVK